MGRNGTYKKNIYYFLNEFIWTTILQYIIILEFNMQRKTTHAEPMNNNRNTSPINNLTNNNLKNHFQSVRTTVLKLHMKCQLLLSKRSKKDVQRVSKPKRSRRPNAKNEEEPQVMINVQPEPVHETAPILPTLHESDLASTRATRPNTTSCNVFGKVSSMKSLNYSQLKTCSGLIRAENPQKRTQVRTYVPSPTRKS